MVDPGGSITCVTKGCSNDAGCIPIQATTDFGTTYWKCSECDKDCTKTTQVTF